MEPIAPRQDEFAPLLLNAVHGSQIENAIGAHIRPGAEEFALLIVDIKIVQLVLSGPLF